MTHRNTLTNEDRANMKPIKDGLGMSWVDRGEGRWAIVRNNAVICAGEGVAAREESARAIARWLQDSEMRGA